MRISKQPNGDYLATDEMPFSYMNINSAMLRITAEEVPQIFDWPLTIELNDRTGFWELWFINPEGNYVEELLDVPELPASDG